MIVSVCVSGKSTCFYFCYEHISAIRLHMFCMNDSDFTKKRFFHLDLVVMQGQGERIHCC